MSNHSDYMQKAIEVAKKSGADVPVGAVIVKNGEILAIAHNKKELSHDVSAHAEILAVREAAAAIENWRLDGCDLYVTLEPCPMCAWAILQSRLQSVYFGSYDTQYGAMGSVFDFRQTVGSKIRIYGGLMENECDNLIEKFWEAKRN